MKRPNQKKYKSQSQLLKELPKIKSIPEEKHKKVKEEDLTIPDNLSYIDMKPKKESPITYIYFNSSNKTYELHSELSDATSSYINNTLGGAKCFIFKAIDTSEIDEVIKHLR